MTQIKGNIFAALVNLYTTSNRQDKARIDTIMEVRYNQGQYIVYNWINENGNPDVEYKGYDIEEATSDLASCVRVECYEGRDQTWFLVEKLGDNEEIVIDSKHILAINTTTDELLNEVRNHFGGKYTTHSTEDGDTIELRIANHSGKHRNIQADKCLSVVIANHNATSKFRTSGPEGIGNEISFDEEYTAEYIIEAINAELLEMGVIEN
jgi:hypothetical protein